MSSLEKQLEKARENWIRAAKKKSEPEMRMWQKWGEIIKRQIAERIGKPLEEKIENTFESAKKIFNAKEEK